MKIAVKRGRMRPFKNATQCFVIIISARGTQVGTFMELYAAHSFATSVTRPSKLGADLIGEVTIYGATVKDRET
jgi:hypothetical protein